MILNYLQASWYTPLETLRLEADVLPYNTCSNRVTLRAWEKALRSFDYHPKRLALTAKIPQRFFNNCGIHRKAHNLVTLLPPELEDHQLINHFSSLPWQAVVMESDLTWTSTTANHPSFTILICTDSKSPKHSCHRNLSHLSFMNPLFPFLHPFTFSGLRDIMTFQTMD